MNRRGLSKRMNSHNTFHTYTLNSVDQNWLRERRIPSNQTKYKRGEGENFYCAGTVRKPSMDREWVSELPAANI